MGEQDLQLMAARVLFGVERRSRALGRIEAWSRDWRGMSRTSIRLCLRLIHEQALAALEDRPTEADPEGEAWLRARDAELRSLPRRERATAEDLPGEPFNTCSGDHTFGACDRDECDFVGGGPPPEAFATYPDLDPALDETARDQAREADAIRAEELDYHALGGGDVAFAAECEEEGRQP